MKKALFVEATDFGFPGVNRLLTEHEALIVFNSKNIYFDRTLGSFVISAIMRQINESSKCRQQPVAEIDHTTDIISYLAGPSWNRGVIGEVLRDNGFKIVGI